MAKAWHREKISYRVTGMPHNVRTQRVHGTCGMFYLPHRLIYHIPHMPRSMACVVSTIDSITSRRVRHKAHQQGGKSSSVQWQVQCSTARPRSLLTTLYETSTTCLEQTTIQTWSCGTCGVKPTNYFQGQSFGSKGVRICRGISGRLLFLIHSSITLTACSTAAFDAPRPKPLPPSAEPPLCSRDLSPSKHMGGSLWA